MLGAIIQMLVGALILTAIVTAVITPLVWFANRNLGWARITQIVAWGVGRGALMLVALFFYTIVLAGGSRHDAPALLLVGIMAVTGWLIHTDLKVARGPMAK